MVELKPVTVTFPRGRRVKALKVEVIGEVTERKRPKGGPEVKIDTESVRSVPMTDLLAYCKKRGFNHSEALARGINSLSIDEAKAKSPSLTARLLRTSAVNGDANKARIASMHLSKLANVGLQPQEISEIVAQLQADRTAKKAEDKEAKDAEAAAKSA